MSAIPKHSDNKVLYTINNIAADFYYHCLRNGVGVDALRYLHGRRLTDRYINAFALGYAPDDHTQLYTILRKDFQDIEIKESGLCWITREGKFVDLFTKRIMFPIFDTHGEVIGFGGRNMFDAPPKYMNVPETPVYKKSAVLYGYHLAKQCAEKEEYILLVEGYMDLIALHQMRIYNSVASCGTALSDHQISSLKSLAHRIILIYDGDQAGINASLRNSEILLKNRARFGLVELPAGVDPCEFITQSAGTPNPRYDFMKRILQRLSFIEYYYRRFISNPDLRLSDFKYKSTGDPYRDKWNAISVDDRSMFIHTIIPMIAMSPSPVWRDVYIKQLAYLTDVSIKSIDHELQNKHGIKPY